MSAPREREAAITCVYGGSFNPPHLAHVLAACAVLATHDVARFLVVPTFRHPFAKALAPFEDRVKLCELAMAGLSRVEVSRVEQELGGESRTLHTLEHLTERHPTWNLRLVVGADILQEAGKWYRFDRVRELAPLLVLGRLGVPHPDAPPPVLPDVSSTRVRAACAEGRFDEVEALVPRAVLAYVRARRLYTSEASLEAPSPAPAHPAPAPSNPDPEKLP